MTGGLPCAHPQGSIAATMQPLRSRRQVIFIVALAAILAMAGGVLLRLSHWPPFHHAARTRIQIETDVPDITPTSPGKGGYDPYFTRVNMISADLNGARSLKAD